jgi:hypothetical protein
MNLAAALAETGQMKEAKIAVEKAIKANPERTIGFLEKHATGDLEIWKRFFASLRKVEFPE